MQLTKKEAGSMKLGKFLGVVAIFGLLGPLVGGTVLWVVATVHGFFSGVGSAAPQWTILLSLLFVIVFAYPAGIAFALLAGMFVAAAGVWARWNGIIVPIISAGLACALVLLLAEFLPSSAWGEPKLIGILPICLIASLVCWFVTRDIVRSTWPPAS